MGLVVEKGEGGEALAANELKQGRWLETKLWRASSMNERC